MKKLLVVSGLVLAVFIAAISETSAQTIYSCYNKKSGTMRYVTGPGQCKKTETEISWNTTGPKGDKGDQGPAGPQGIQGDKGDNGNPSIIDVLYLSESFVTEDPYTSENIGYFANGSRSFSLNDDEFLVISGYVSAEVFYSYTVDAYFYYGICVNNSLLPSSLTGEFIFRDMHELWTEPVIISYGSIGTYEPKSEKLPIIYIGRPEITSGKIGFCTSHPNSQGPVPNPPSSGHYKLYIIKMKNTL